MTQQMKIFSDANPEVIQDRFNDWVTPDINVVLVQFEVNTALQRAYLVVIYETLSVDEAMRRAEIYEKTGMRTLSTGVTERATDPTGVRLKTGTRDILKEAILPDSEDPEAPDSADV